MKEKNKEEEDIEGIEVIDFNLNIDEEKVKEVNKNNNIIEEKEQNIEEEINTNKDCDSNANKETIDTEKTDLNKKEKLKIKSKAKLNKKEEEEPIGEVLEEKFITLQNEPQKLNLILSKKAKVKKKKSNVILSIDEANKFCVDCGKENPSFISINHGTLICESCSEIHKILGPSVSFLKNINDNLDEYLFSYLSLGSNTKFKDFLIKENVNPHLSIDKKYLTKAVEFYRKDLKRKVLGKDEENKDYDNPNELVFHTINEFGEEENSEFPEFDNYVLDKIIIKDGKQKKKKKNYLKFFGVFNIFNFNKKNADTDKKAKTAMNFNYKKNSKINNLNNNVKSTFPENQFGNGVKLRHKPSSKKIKILDSCRQLQSENEKNNGCQLTTNMNLNENKNNA